MYVGLPHDAFRSWLTTKLRLRNRVSCVLCVSCRGFQVYRGLQANGRQVKVVSHHSAEGEARREGGLLEDGVLEVVDVNPSSLPFRD